MKTNQQRKIKKRDRISSLPDSILSVILSFLDTKTVVRTAVLSKRWKLMWTLIPDLDFNVNAFPNSHGRFFQFVKHVLARRSDAPLVRLRLFLNSAVPPSLVQDCFIYASDHRVRNIRISAHTCSDDKPLSLMNCLLSSRYLQVLRLCCLIPNSIALPKSWAFPNLKYLKLKNFMFSDDNFDEGKIFSGCPKLESVILSKCGIKGEGKLKELEMKCLELKNLEISYWRSRSDYYGSQRINVIAPKLSSFVFKGNVANLCFKEDLSFLDRVRVDLRYPKWNRSADRKRWTGECFMTMFGQFHSVRFLSLSIDTIEALSAISGIHDYGAFTFDNLRHIKFVTEDKASSITIPVSAVADVLKHTADGSLVFDAFEDKKLSARAKSSNSDSRNDKKDENIIDIPIHLMSYLLEIASCAESLTVEFAKVVSETNFGLEKEYYNLR